MTGAEGATEKSGGEVDANEVTGPVDLGDPAGNGGSDPIDKPPRGRRGDVEDDSERAKIEDIRNNIELRKRYADKAHLLAQWVVRFWMAVVLVDGALTALGHQPYSDKALIAITSGATVNVLAAFLGVIRGLFPSPSESASGKKNKKGKAKEE